MAGNLGFLGFYNFKSRFLPLKITCFFQGLTITIPLCLYKLVNKTMSLVQFKNNKHSMYLYNQVSRMQYWALVTQKYMCFSTRILLKIGEGGPLYFCILRYCYKTHIIINKKSFFSTQLCNNRWFELLIAKSIKLNAT